MIKKYEAVIFDMDGLLVDSEPYWKIAEKEIFGNLGLELSDELLRQVMGFRLSEVVAHWYRYQSWTGKTFTEVEAEIIEKMLFLLSQDAKAMPGVYDILDYLKSNNYKIALASSSAMSLIKTVVKTLEIECYFDIICSAEGESYGKPHPGIFISTSKKLKIIEPHCLVFEDSLNGMISAKSARMDCAVVPEKEKFDDLRWNLAEYKLHSLADFKEIDL